MLASFPKEVRVQEDLCALFHQQALCASSGLLFQRVGQSEAAGRLRKGGKASLPGIVAFLERQQHDPDFDYSDMRGVWSFLLNQMKQDLDPTGEQIPFLDTDRWIAWAKKITET